MTNRALFSSAINHLVLQADLSFKLRHLNAEAAAVRQANFINDFDSVCSREIAPAMSDISKQLSASGYNCKLRRCQERPNSVYIELCIRRSSRWPALARNFPASFSYVCFPARAKILTFRRFMHETEECGVESPDDISRENVKLCIISNFIQKTLNRLP